MVPQQFLFVDNSKGEQGSSQGRRTVRSFVMQRARRERPWSTSKHAGKDKVSKRRPERGSATPESDLDLAQPLQRASTRWRDLAQPSFQQPPRTSQAVPCSGPPLLCKECRAPLPYGQPVCLRCAAPIQSTTFGPRDGVAERMLDPFGSFPVEIDRKTSELLNHFFFVLSPGSLPLDVRSQFTLMRSDWFTAALAHRGFMHSVLCATAFHLYIMGKGSYDTIMHHKSQAVAEINANLSNQTLGISDGNIGAVFSLLCVEEAMFLPMFEQPEVQEPQNQRLIHLNGLLRMVELRGGLHKLQSNRCLQSLILRHSTAHAVASFFPPYISSHTDTTKLVTDRMLNSRALFGIHNSAKQLSKDKDLLEIIESLAHYNANLDDLYNNPTCQLDILDIQNHSSVLQCLLLNWINERFAPYRKPSEVVLCIVLLVYVVGVSEGTDRRIDPLHFTATKRLQKAFIETPHSDWDACPELLVWSATIGAIGAYGSYEGPWFIRQVKDVCHRYGIVSYDDFSTRLQGCLWLKSRLYGMAEKVWDEAKSLRLDGTATRSTSPGGGYSRMIQQQYNGTTAALNETTTETTTPPRFESLDPQIWSEEEAYLRQVFEGSQTQLLWAPMPAYSSMLAPITTEKLDIPLIEPISKTENISCPYNPVRTTGPEDPTPLPCHGSDEALPPIHHDNNPNISRTSEVDLREYYERVGIFGTLSLPGYPLGTSAPSSCSRITESVGYLT